MEGAEVLPKGMTMTWHNISTQQIRRRLSGRDELWISGKHPDSHSLNFKVHILSQSQSPLNMRLICNSVYLRFQGFRPTGSMHFRVERLARIRHDWYPYVADFLKIDWLRFFYHTPTPPKIVTWKMSRCREAERLKSLFPFIRLIAPRFTFICAAYLPWRSWDKRCVLPCGERDEKSLWALLLSENWRVEVQLYKQTARPTKAIGSRIPPVPSSPVSSPVCRCTIRFIPHSQNSNKF